MSSTTTAQTADFSYLNGFSDCARKGFYLYELSLVSREPRYPREAGSALHEAVRVLHKEAWDYERAREAMLETWKGLQPPPGHKHAHLTEGFLEVVLRDYMDEVNPDHFMLLHTPEGKPLLEEVFVVDWDGLPYGVKMDSARNYSGSNYVLDYKGSTWKPTDFFWSKYRLSHQLRGYQAAAQILTGQEFAGALILHIYIGKDRVVRRTTLSPPFNFTEPLLRETREWAEQTLEDIERWRATGRWPQNTQACSNFGGCEFRSLCEASPVLRPSLVKRDFDVRERNGALLSGADSTEEV